MAVVDVLRATTSLVTMFDRGLARAIIPDTLRDARALALSHFSLLCGESKALPLAGFDYGNSPAEFATLSLKDKSAVLWTTNGTKAIAAAEPDAGFRFPAAGVRGGLLPGGEKLSVGPPPGDGGIQDQLKNAEKLHEPCPER